MPREQPQDELWTPPDPEERRQSMSERRLKRLEMLLDPTPDELAEIQFLKEMLKPC